MSDEGRRDELDGVVVEGEGQMRGPRRMSEKKGRGNADGIGDEQGTVAVEEARGVSGGGGGEAYRRSGGQRKGDAGRGVKPG